LVDLLEASHILIVDDDDRIRELLSTYLVKHGFYASQAEDTIEADSLMELFAFDLIIMDYMMPGENGIGFIKRIRGDHNVPIIMLTAMGEVGSRIEGLESGADDYLAKPFEPKELLLRIKNLIARSKGKTDKNIIKLGEVSFNLASLRFTRADQHIPMTHSEAKLLSILAINSGKIVSREELAMIGGVNERSIDVQIIRLRNKIEKEPSKPLFLQTVRGKGYTLRPE
jgi:two-component system, OmpR family, phosphate regulon response regulator OmpR